MLEMVKIMCNGVQLRGLVCSPTSLICSSNLSFILPIFEPYPSHAMAMFEQLIIPVMSGWLFLINLCICKCYCMFHISARHLLLPKVVAVVRNNLAGNLTCHDASRWFDEERIINKSRSEKHGRRSVKIKGRLLVVILSSSRLVSPAWCLGCRRVIGVEEVSM